MQRSSIVRRRSRLPLVFALAGAGALGLVIGCGGGGGGGSAPAKPMSGLNGQRAIAISDAKSTAAGTAVAFNILKQVSPTANTFAKAFSIFGSRDPVFVPALNLYASSVTTGKILTVNYYTDAAGKTSAGSITVTASQTIGATYMYPVSFHAVGDETASNPC